jgi:hypothetical protein
MGYYLQRLNKGVFGMGTPEQFISDAANRKSEFSFRDFKEAMTGCELYFNFQEEVVNGVVSRVTPLGKVPTGFRGVVFFTSRNNSHLNRPYAGMPFEIAIQMAASITNSDGIIIENEVGDWISVASSSFSES